MKKIKIAQIGTSRFSHGNGIFATLKCFPELFDIVGYALPENEREKFPENMGEFNGYREMTVEDILSDPSIEAVTVETEEIYLTKYAQLAANAKKHIHMEKPGSLSLPDFEALIETVKKNKTVFHTGYMYRYNPVIRDVIRRAKAGDVGDVISVEAQMNCYHGEECTRWLSTFNGGMMFFLGCHLVDLVLQLQGLPTRVIPVNRSSGRFDGISSQDNAFALFEYERGASFVKVSAAERGGFARRRLVVTGTKGRLLVEPLEEYTDAALLHTKYNECMTDGWCDAGEQKTSPTFCRYDEMMRTFAALVRGEKENPYTYDYELTLYKLLRECCQ